MASQSFSTWSMRGVAIEGAVKNVGGRGIRGRNGDHHANGTGLAGAIGSQQAEDCSLFNIEGEIIHGYKMIVRLADFVQFYGVHEVIQLNISRLLRICNLLRLGKSVRPAFVQLRYERRLKKLQRLMQTRKFIWSRWLGSRV